MGEVLESVHVRHLDWLPDQNYPHSLHDTQPGYHMRPSVDWPTNILLADDGTRFGERRRRKIY
jgi:hypothetical protein